MSWPQFSVRRPVTTVMIYLGVALMGVIAWFRLPQELFPPITYPQLTIVTRYKDAAPEEIELLVTKPIEEVAGTVSGLRRISSISKEELSLVIAEFNWDTHMDFAGLGVREKIDLIKERLPRGAEEPVVIKYNPFELPVLVLNLTGDVEPHELLNIARKQVKNEIEKVEGVAVVNISGGLEREILVEVDQGRLQSANMPISQVVDSLSRANLNYPAGTIKEAFYEYLIRTMGEFKLVNELPGIAVGVDEREEDPEQQMQRQQKESLGGPLERETGAPPRQRLVLLKDIAQVKDTLRDPESISRFNGKENISLSIQKQAGANTVRLAAAVKEEIEQLRQSLPPGLKLSVAYDQSTVIRSSISGVSSAALQGAGLAFLVLLLFLGNVGSALNVALAIPIAILATMALMFFTGTTINTLSLGGLAFGIGLLIDCGIIVVENIARKREQGLPGKEAAVQGAEEMGKEIVGSEITNLVVFLPFVLVIGLVGQFMKDFSLTVILSNIVGLFVALTLTTLLGSLFGNWKGFRSPLEPFLVKAVRWNGRAVAWFLHHSKLAVLIVVGLFVLSLGLMTTLDRELMPRVDQGQFIMRASLPPGSRLEVTDKVVRRIERVLQAMPETQDVTVTIGSAKEKRAEELLETLGSHQAQMLINLKPRHLGFGFAPPGHRTKKTAAVVQELKETLSREPLEGAQVEYLLQESVFKSAFMSGAPIVVEVKGTELPNLEKLARQVEKRLQEVPGVYGIQTSMIPPSPETKVHVMKDRAATYHLSVSDIALTAQTAFKGFVATKFKEEGKEIDIRVRLRKQDRENLNQVRNLMIHSPLDIDVPLAEVAYLSKGMGPTEIRHADQQRTVLVSAQLYGKPLGATLDHIASVMAKSKLPPGYSVALTGENQQMKESFNSLFFALALSVLLVYMVMASVFESLWQPLLVMGSIPMAAIGVAIVLWLTQTPLSVMVGVGFIVLGGIVVDNGISMVEAVNRIKERRPDVTLREALVEASMARFRPILMTAATTVLGVFPLTLGLGQGVELQQPMAITVMGGLAAATFLTLIFLPTLYAIGADFFMGLPGARKWGDPPPEGGQPPPGVEPSPELPPIVGFPLTPPSPLRGEGKGEGIASPPPAPAFPEIPDNYGDNEAVPDKQESGMFFPVIGPPEPPEQPVPPEPLPEPPPEEPLRQEAEESIPEEPLPEEPAVEEPQVEPPLPEQASTEEPYQPLSEPSQIEIPEPPREEDLPLVVEPIMEETPVSEPPPVEPPAAPTLNSRQEMLLKYLREHGRITRKEFVEVTGASVPTAARDLKELVDKGLIKGIGPFAKGRYYVLA